MKFFKRKHEDKLAVVECEPVTYNKFNPVTVSVPEIKDYLVQEYERANGLQQTINDLEAKLEIANEVKIKYDAAMVTLDEYSKRLAVADSKIYNAQEKVRVEKENHAITRDELNSYKIQLNNAALTKEQIKYEIVKEIKDEIILAIKTYKGNLSKTTACAIVEQAELCNKLDYSTEQYGEYKAEDYSEE